jgi:hypothetical protein
MAPDLDLDLAAIFFEIKKILWRTAPPPVRYKNKTFWCAIEIRLSVAHGPVRHRILIFGAQLMSLFLLVFASSSWCVSISCSGQSCLF